MSSNVVGARVQAVHGVKGTVVSSGWDGDVYWCIQWDNMDSVVTHRSLEGIRFFEEERTERSSECVCGMWRLDGQGNGVNHHGQECQRWAPRGIRCDPSDLNDI